MMKLNNHGFITWNQDKLLTGPPDHYSFKLDQTDPQ